MTFDWGFGDPHLAAANSGNTASGQFSAGEATPSMWFVAPTPIGPFSARSRREGERRDGRSHQRVRPERRSVHRGRWQQAVDPNAPGLRAGHGRSWQDGLAEAHDHAQRPPWRVVRGTLYVDDFSQFLAFGNELLAIPYEYTVG